MGQESITSLFENDILGKSGKKSKHHRVKNIVNYAPEVMVKVSGFSSSPHHMKAHLNYISREGEISLEDENGYEIKGKKEIHALYEDWKSIYPDSKKDKRLTTSIILSMPYDTEVDEMRGAVRDFAKNTFGKNHQYVMALHEDTDNPHVHLTVNNFGRDRKKLHIKNGDPQKWREAFALQLNRRGVNAEATSRAVRGVVQRSQKQPLIHIRERGITPETDQSKMQEAFELVRQSKDGKITRDYPWNDKIMERQKSVRKGWLNLADKLQESDLQEDKDLSDHVKSFVRKMPVVKTERHLLYRKASSIVQQEENKPKDIQRDDECEL